MWSWLGKNKSSESVITPVNPKSFWDWLTENEVKLAAQLRQYFMAQDGENVAFTAISAALNRYSSNLFFECGIKEDQTIDFIVSADSKFENFPEVIKLMAMKPDSKHFNFLSFRQRTTGFSLNMHGLSISPEQCDFALRQSETNGAQIDLLVLVEAPDLPADELFQFVLVMLDNVLGEYDMCAHVGLVDVLQKHEVKGLSTKRLNHLPAEFDQYLTSLRLN
jgi:hypothetical protein